MSERLSTEEREWLGTVLLPLLGDESSGPLEWHGCKPDCGPCACSGVPYLGPEVTAAIEAILAARLADQAARLAAVELVLAKWACPPLENRGSTLVLRDLRAALHLDPSPQEPRL